MKKRRWEPLVIILTEDERMENELFEKTPVPKAYFTFALPVVFSMVVSLVYNMVDTYFIAQTVCRYPIFSYK